MMLRTVDLIFLMAVVVIEFSAVTAEQFCRCYEAASATKHLYEDALKKPDKQSVDKIQNFIDGNRFLMQQFYGDYQPENIEYSTYTNPPLATKTKQSDSSHWINRNTKDLSAGRCMDTKKSWSRVWKSSSRKRSTYSRQMTYEAIKRGHEISRNPNSNVVSDFEHRQSSYSLPNDRLIWNSGEQKQTKTPVILQQPQREYESFPWQRNTFYNETKKTWRTVPESRSSWVNEDDHPEHDNYRQLLANQFPRMQSRRTKRSLYDGRKPEVANSNFTTCCGETHHRMNPHHLENLLGEQRVVVNTPPFEQVVDTARCNESSPNIYCRPPCKCQQFYRLHRLMVIDPNSTCRGVFMDWFMLESHCSCHCPKN